MSTVTLLEADHLQVTAGLELYDADENLIGDISDSLESGSVTHNIFATIHRTAELRVARLLEWGSERVKPYVTISAPELGLSDTWSLGVFVLSVPERRLSDSDEVYEVTCFDKLMVADTPVGRSYAVDTGTGYLAAVETILTTELGESKVLLSQAAAGDTLTSPMVWQLDANTTWLNVINDLLAAVGYEALWVDADGFYRSNPYTLPSQRTPVWSFDTSSATTTVGEERVVTADFTDAPNRWVFYRSNADGALPVPGDGLYTVVNQSDGPTSIDARGRTITRVVPLEASSQASLQAQGDRIVANDKRVTTKVEMTCSPNPTFGHLNVVELFEPRLGSAANYAVEQWSFSLTGDDTELRLRKVD